MTVRVGQATWEGAGAPVTLGTSHLGSGPSALMLPALSSISTRREMHPLMGALAGSFESVAIDWPGFGDLDKPRIDWTPELLSWFLAWVLTDVAPRPDTIVAAGHAASYVLRHAATNTGTARRLVLIAPTWRGPLPTMMKGRRPWFGRAVRAMDAPVLGHALYRLNLSRPVIERMARQHVYSQADWLSGERMREKRGVARASGARHGSVRFVTGMLDAFDSRAEFLATAEQCGIPMLVIVGAETPPRSKAEMEALADCSNTELVHLNRGKLAVHDEYPKEVADQILNFARPAPASD